MKLDILYLIFVGYFIQVSEEGGNGKHVHVKIHVPYHVHKHNHKHTVYKKVPVHVGEKKHIVIHKHNHNHNHKHDHGHKHGHKHQHGHKHGHKHHGKHDHKHGHKHDHKHKHLVEKHHGYGHGHHYEAEPQVDLYNAKYAIDPVSVDGDGYKSSKKSVRSEHYEVEQKNPYATWPDEQHVVKGSYKVQETDPYDFTTTSYQAYDSPVGKQIAQALTNFNGYDAINTPQQVNDHEDYVEAEGEGEGEVAADHENVEEDGEDSQDVQDDGGHLNYQNYEDYGDTDEKVEQYTADSNHGVPQNVDEGYNYGTEQVEKYILRKVYGSENH